MPRIDILQMKSKPSQPRTFRVPVPLPSNHKIQAVASYKRQKYKCNANKVNRNTKEQNVLTSTTATVSVATTSSDAITTTSSPSLLAENTQEYEESQKQLEQLYTKGQELRQELQSLHGVRCSLLWLLKKATTLETQKNHLHQK